MPFKTKGFRLFVVCFDRCHWCKPKRKAFDNTASHIAKYFIFVFFVFLLDYPIAYMSMRTHKPSEGSLRKEKDHRI